MSQLRQNKQSMETSQSRSRRCHRGWHGVGSRSSIWRIEVQVRSTPSHLSPVQAANRPNNLRKVSLAQARSQTNAIINTQFQVASPCKKQRSLFSPNQLSLLRNKLSLNLKLLQCQVEPWQHPNSRAMQYKKTCFSIEEERHNQMFQIQQKMILSILWSGHVGSSKTKVVLIWNKKDENIA